MKSQMLVSILLVAALGAAAARPAHAGAVPVFSFAAGTTLGADSSPAGGGASLTLSPMWPVSDRVRFGVSLFADDIGSDLGDLFDPNDQSNLGTVSLGHRWTWGAAWRGDVDLARAGRWAASASGTWGWWRVEDDLRGTPVASASSVGAGIGMEVRRSVAPGQTLGLLVRGQRLFAQGNSSYRRVQHYATAALEWNWAGAAQP